MTYEQFLPQSRQNPLVQEAQFIAQQMDSGNSRFAVQRLQEDLQQLQGYPDSQKQLISLVDRMEQKGEGADIQTQIMRAQDGRLYADVSAIDYQYSSDGYQTIRQPYSSQRIAAVFVNQDTGYQNYFDQRQAGWQAPQQYRFNVDQWGRQQFGMPRQQYIPQRQLPDLTYQSQLQRMGYNMPDGYPHVGYSHRQQQFGPQRRQQFEPQRQQLHFRPQTTRHNHNPAHEGSPTNGRLTDACDDALDYAKQLAARDGVRIDVSSAGRTYKQQSILYRELHGKSPVAKPGTSSHEFGVAIDVRNPEEAKPYLLAAGFVHGDGRGKIAGDPWHFRYMGA